MPLPILPPSPHNFPFFFLFFASLASPPDLSLRVTSLEGPTWVGLPQPSRWRCLLGAEVGLGVWEGRIGLLVIYASPGSVLGMVTDMLNEGLWNP